METAKWLKKLLLLDGNETNIMDKRALDDFRRLLVELSKKQNDIRWCSGTGCPCHPESAIKYILENNEYLVKELKVLIDYEAFKEFAYSEYEPKTVFVRS